ncbi:hypothetical protein A6X20_06875 [Bradyrhizobium elkanii]|nr:hypothetical protein A6X20_06875 [Bradyrhizobium elkanii]
MYETYGVAKIPPAAQPSDHLDCRGRAHIAFQHLTAVEGDGHKLHLVRSVIDIGEVFVMNSEGKTVAMYRFEADDRKAIAA